MFSTYETSYVQPVLRIFSYEHYFTNSYYYTAILIIFLCIHTRNSNSCVMKNQFLECSAAMEMPLLLISKRHNFTTKCQNFKQPLQVHFYKLVGECSTVSWALYVSEKKSLFHFGKSRMPKGLESLLSKCRSIFISFSAKKSS